MYRGLPRGISGEQGNKVSRAGPGAWQIRDLKESLAGMLNAIKTLQKRDVRVVKLSDVEKVWNDGGERIVFVP